MDTVSFSTARSWPEIDPSFQTAAATSQGQTIAVSEGETAFGFVYSGAAWTERSGLRQQLHTEMFFSIPGPASVISLHGFVCVRKNYRGVPMWGGPLEVAGRLKYIDGCSDTLLLAPPVKGDPCLNYLHVPPGVSQTPHTHPSARAGCVVSGAGFCRVAGRTVDLLPGTIFILPADELHSFHTSDQPLRIVVYHPDSDFGPTDEVHPMINRTIITKDADVCANGKTAEMIPS